MWRVSEVNKLLNKKKILIKIKNISLNEKIKNLANILSI